jgi:hypothetical protein
VFNDRAIDVLATEQVVPSVFQNIQPTLSGRNHRNIEGPTT